MLGQLPWQVRTSSSSHLYIERSFPSFLICLSIHGFTVSMDIPVSQTVMSEILGTGSK